MNWYSKIHWMDRSTMIERGATMLAAHYKNRCSTKDLDIWYRRTLSRYAAFDSSPHITASEQRKNRLSVTSRFWLEAERRLWQRYGYSFTEERKA